MYSEEPTGSGGAGGGDEEEAMDVEFTADAPKKPKKFKNNKLRGKKVIQYDMIQSSLNLT